ncbi:hypothetical protein [Alicyclobacillus fodiniaquatilis]|uniref:Uncharacterized protein n=1 Tax=Alicyclobacillus fodiniaquatilis TaxID=1661150 RepID=A0ABW4JCK2_9BACL
MEIVTRTVNMAIPAAMLIALIIVVILLSFALRRRSHRSLVPISLVLVILSALAEILWIYLTFR